MRATLCALAFGLSFLLPGSLFGQWGRSEHLNVANLNPPPMPFREALRVEGFPEPPQGLHATPSEVRRLQIFANRMEAGPRDASDRAFNKQEEVRNHYLATVRPLFPEYRYPVTQPWTRGYTDHELRYYGKYILPPPSAALSPSMREELQQHELRTPTTPFPLRDRP
jgi:hypothetical protein